MKPKLRLAILLLLACGLIGFDIGLTVLAARICVEPGVKADWHAFRTSFWSGIAYSAWIATLLSVAAGTMIWLVEDMFRQRWQSAQDRDRMSAAAVAAINALYNEFPRKPDIQYVPEGGKVQLAPVNYDLDESRRSVYLTNSASAAQEWQAEHEAAARAISELVLSDQALACVPVIAARVFRRFSKVSPTIWQADSPMFTDMFLPDWIGRFMTAYRRLIAISFQLDYRLRYHVRLKNASLTADTYEDEADRCYYLGTVLGFREVFLLTALMPNDELGQTQMKKRHTALRKVDNLEILVAPFIEAMQEIQNLLVEFQNSPKMAPISYRGWYYGDPPWAPDD